MAVYAICHRLLAMRYGVTCGADGVVVGRVFSERLVRGVAGQAGKFSSAFLKTRASAKVRRLETHVPLVVPIKRRAGGGRETMAAAAGVVQLRGRQVARIADSRFASGSLMLGAGAVAGFAAHACFMWAELAAADVDGACRVAFEALGSVEIAVDESCNIA